MRKLNAITALLLAVISSVIGVDSTESDLIWGDTMIASRAMYTAEWISKTWPISWASKSAMELVTLHGVTEDAPYWETEVILTNDGTEAMAGFVAIYSAIYDPQSDWNLDIEDLRDLCRRRGDLESGSTGHSHVRFEEWSFDPVSGRHAGRWSLDPVELRLNVTQPVHESGLWVNIVHLCVTEGVHHRWALTMDGHQTAVNPLGFLGGEWLMALPVLMTVLILYAVIGFLWTFRMIVHRQNLIQWIHCPLTVGVAMAFLETMLRLHRFYAVNVRGVHHLSMNRLIVDGTVKFAVSMYCSVMMVILCGGVGVARPGLGRKTKILVLFYIVLHSAAFARIEYLEFLVFSNGAFGSSDVAEMLSLCRFLIASQLVLIVVSFFNLHAVLDRLERDGQHSKIGVFHALAVIAFFTAIGLIELEAAGNSEAINGYAEDRAKWMLYYLVKDGFKRMLTLIAAAAVLYIYAPHAHSLRLVYSDQVACNETDQDVNLGDTAPEQDASSPHPSVTAHEERDTSSMPLP